MLGSGGLSWKCEGTDGISWATQTLGHQCTLLGVFQVTERCSHREAGNAKRRSRHSVPRRAEGTVSTALRSDPVRGLISGSAR